MQLTTKSAFIAFALVTPILAEPIFAPGDFILGGARIGDNFVIGTPGTAGGSNNWPGAEPPSDVINGIIGGGGEKIPQFHQAGCRVHHHAFLRPFGGLKHGALGRQ